MTNALTRYDIARQALVDCVRIDIAKDVRDKTVAVTVYARAAGDRELEANAVELRQRATRKLSELVIADKAVGRIAEGRPRKNGTGEEPFSRVRLKELGLDKKLSVFAQRLARMPAADFETRLKTAVGALLRCDAHARRPPEKRP